MKRLNRTMTLGAIVLGVIVLLTLIAAPSNSHLNTGSTYNRAPNGYGAWYAFMQQRGTPIQRWQKPFSNLLEEKRSITLLRVNSQTDVPVLAQMEQDWVKKGNTLVILGVQGRVTEAAFSTMQQSTVGSVKIDTRRRQSLLGRQYQEKQLGDRFGAVVWEEQLSQGRVIFSTTPHLAANAYQGYPSNYTYLAHLLSKDGSSILVDEYIHGYKDPDVGESEAEGDLLTYLAQDLLTYLAQTPLFPMLLQVGVLLLVLFWAQSWRFGPPVSLNTPVVDNSEAYIQALAGVLQKAECSELVLDVVGSYEQLQLQKALGLGQVLLDRQTLVNAWAEQTKLTAVELEQVLRLQSQKRRVSEKELLTWLGKWQLVQRQLPLTRFQSLIGIRTQQPPPPYI